MRLSDDELRSALRAEAAAHRPDREAMLDRITQTAMNPARPAQRRGSRTRMAAAAAAVVAVLAGGGVANWALAGDADPDQAVPTPAPTTTAPAPSPVASAPSPSALPSSPAASLAASQSAPQSAPQSPSAPPSKPATSRPASKPATATPPSVAQGPLWSDGSVAPDGGASVITLKTTEQLTALEVVIRVARTEGLASRGGTKQTPGASVTTSVTEEPDALLYRFVLSSADTLAPGTYTFTAKYTHPAGSRDAGADTYQATATAASGPIKVNGTF
ncbi:hypothetical protein AB0F81_20620 [Actinoplanes sp. NPDC024001]|uniref:hypothetical protein n=1 Tax=Actinoplanes sp. NPDC024001 TaxID=3154598 RepID=UPI0033F35060